MLSLKGGGAKVLFTGQKRPYQPGAASQRDIGAKHRLNFSFYFSGGVFRVRAPLPGGKWGANRMMTRILGLMRSLL